MRAIRGPEGRAVRADTGRGLTDEACCCDAAPTCDFWYKAIRCFPIAECQSAPEEFYVRCDYACVSGSGFTIRVGPWRLCYVIDTNEFFIPDPGNGEPPPPNRQYLPPNAYLWPETEFECQQDCFNCTAPSLWYEIERCECDPGSGVPLWLDCVAYHNLIEQARQYGDPFECFAFSGFTPQAGSFCFTLLNGVVYTQFPPGDPVGLAGLLPGGCCACCDFPCQSIVFHEYTLVNEVMVREKFRRCCCHRDNFTGTANSHRLFYGRTFAGEYALFVEELESRTLDGLGLTIHYQTIPRHPEYPFPAVNSMVTLPASRCDWEGLFNTVVWGPFGLSPDWIGRIHRTCGGGDADYTVYGDFGFGREVFYTVTATATLGGDTGNCPGCSNVPGGAFLAGELLSTTRFL